MEPVTDDDYNHEKGRAPDVGKDAGSDRSTQFLANERTFLAWLRTCIAIIGLGFVVARFSLFLREFGVIMATRSGGGSNQIPQEASSLSTHSPSSMLGLGMVGLGIILAAYSFYNYRKAHNIIESGGMYIPRQSIMYVATISLIAFGLVVIVYLLLISL